MAYTDLRAYIAALEAAGELKRIRTEVDPILQITEITDRVSKQHGPALLFENPTGYAGRPFLINQFGSSRRMAMALEVEQAGEIAQRIRDLLELKPPSGVLDKLKMLPTLAEFGAFLPKSVKSGPCKEVVRSSGFSILDFPIPQCWPGDGGRFITLPCVFSKHPVTGRRNAGMYRLQVYDERTLGMHWQIHKQGAENFRERLRAQGEGRLAAPSDAIAALNRAVVLDDLIGRAHALPEAQAPVNMADSGQASARMEVAAVIGTDPTVTFAATLPLPPSIDEMMFAGFLRRKPVEMVRCETVDLEVPATAEIVLEGYVDLQERRLEGPFGDHTGCYSLADYYPVFHLTCITHRRDPIYASTIVGKPPMEDDYMGEAIERIFLPLMQMQFPEIVDMHMPFEGVFHNLMIVAIRKSYPGHARKIMNGIWGLGQAMFTKCIVVLDEDADVRDLSDVVLKVGNNIDPERDIQFTLGPVDALDHAARLPGLGSKMGVDATRKWPSEGFSRPWPREIQMDGATCAAIDRLWPMLGLG